MLDFICIQFDISLFVQVPKKNQFRDISVIWEDEYKGFFLFTGWATNGNRYKSIWNLHIEVGVYILQNTMVLWIFFSMASKEKRGKVKTKQKVGYDRLAQYIYPCNEELNQVSRNPNPPLKLDII